MDKNDIIDYVMHTPHNTNKAVLSDMLNQLTEGGGGGAEPLIVNVSSSSPKTLDRTWQEIHDALANGIPAYLKGTDPDVSEYITLTPIWGTDQNFETNLYEVYSLTWNRDGFDRIAYAAETSDGYPQGRS